MNKKILLRLSQSPVWPALLSAFVAPGVGQIFNGEFKKGLLLIFATFGSFYWFFKVVGERLALISPGGAENWYDNPAAFKTQLVKLFQETPEVFFLFYSLVILLVVYGVADAYITARQLRRNHTPPKEKDESDPDR